MTFRVLFVEDERAWQDALRDSAVNLLAGVDCEFAASAGQARDLFAKHHFHFVSIDQNTPDDPTEFVDSQYGLNLCEALIRYFPLTDRAIYTGYGAIPLAHKASRLDGTPYIEKRLASRFSSESAMDVADYVRWIRCRLDKDYHTWALERAARTLPGRLAALAGAVATEWRTGGTANWNRAVACLGLLVELAINLAWAQTMGLLRHGRIELPQLPFQSARDKLDALPRLWGAMKAARTGDIGWLAPWTKAFGAPGRSRDIGAPGRDALASLIVLRNDLAHGRLETAAAEDLESRKADTLLLLDVLSLWAERPLVSGLRYHPGERGRIQFQRHAGPPPERWDDMKDDFDGPPAHPANVHVVWPRAGRLEFADLHPFVIVLRNEQRRYEPFVLRDWQRGIASYVSLHTGTERKVSAEEAPAVLADIATAFAPPAGNA